jgi:hypothetical protein
MKISDLHNYIDDIPNSGQKTKESLKTIVELIVENINKLGLIDNVGDLYVNANIVEQFLDENNVKDSEIYMNILFDIPEVKSYIDMEGYGTDIYSTVKEIRQSSDNIVRMTLINIFCTAISCILVLF